MYESTSLFIFRLISSFRTHSQHSSTPCLCLRNPLSHPSSTFAANSAISSSRPYSSLPQHPHRGAPHRITLRAPHSPTYSIARASSCPF
ncbi:hypothetical protein BU26DRAFT_211703 [Trematosphaeria pertusa]|uniref:Uncharacterized protein n=1 Tax=Trematosphaeria pertusa TaxID=390896 RepID=A0A6A6ISW7_9PLEO|nr:uncharacterized protein BU26DRAFT_211703 [Trematosphaeria pertusa]KAF2252922.1 hypothetical protein BU26DRAFT_211703 [Trematosphaeria pertusa]